MSVWLCIPSARPDLGTVPEWKARGYKVAVFVDKGLPASVEVDLASWCVEDGEGPAYPAYPGYARAVNWLAATVLERDPECNWIVTGGDDTLPDPRNPEEIAAECTAHFGGTFGVMQPTGDRFANGSIDKIAGSPWMGREWCLRANQGAGPLYPEFTHMFVDQALQETAEKLGVYWQRPDLVHLHRHFMRESDAINSRAVSKPVPQHLVQWNSRRHWDEMKAIYERLKAEGFAPCMPLECNRTDGYAIAKHGGWMNAEQISAKQ